MCTSKKMKKTAQLRVDKKQLEAKLEEALEKNAKLEAETECLTAENKQLKSEMVLNEHYASKAIQLDTENAKLKADLEELRNDKPQYDTTDKKKARINGFCFVISMAVVLSNPYLTWISKDKIALLNMVFLTILFEIPEYIRYFTVCTNRRKSWDITKGISMAMDVVSLILCLMIAGGETLFSYPVVIFFGMVIAKKFLPDFGRLICALADAFN